MHDTDGLRAMLAGCLDIPRWVEQVAAGAPYASREQLQEAGRTAADPLTPQEIEQAVAAHPRIGDQRTQALGHRLIGHHGVARLPLAALRHQLIDAGGPRQRPHLELLGMA